MQTGTKAIVLDFKETTTIPANQVTTTPARMHEAKTARMHEAKTAQVALQLIVLLEQLKERKAYLELPNEKCVNQVQLKSY